VRLAGLSGRSLWAAGCWSAHHLRWSFLVVLVTAGVDLSGLGILLTVEVGAGGLAPALLAGFWITRWPVGYEVHVSAPWRRTKWRRRVRRTWPEFSEAVGLGQLVPVTRKVDGQKVTEEVWRPAKIKLSASSWSVTAAVPVPLGKTIADVVGVADALGSAVGAHTVRARKVSMSLGEIECCMIDALAVPRGSVQPSASGPIIFGRREDGRDLVWDPVRDVHLAIQGMTRSGKSIATYTLLSELSARNDVIVTGVDPSGVLLRPWADGPHRDLIALGTRDLSQAARVVTTLVDEMERRIETLWSRATDKIEVFSADEPVIVVVLEEWPGLLTSVQLDDAAHGRKPAERLGPVIEGSVGRLIREGAKVGIRVIVLAQRMSAEAINTNDRSNFSLRLTFRVDSGDSIRMLHPGCDVDPAEVRAFDPGIALYESPSSGLQRARIDFTDYSAYCRRARRWVKAAPAPAAALRRETPAPAPAEPLRSVVVEDQIPVQVPADPASVTAAVLDAGAAPAAEAPARPARPRQAKRPRRPAGS
jgi:hypothetical protein